MTDLYVLALQDIDADHFPIVGGKAANLAKLANWEFPTLDGFCVTTDAYKDTLRDSNLDNQINNIFADIELDNLDLVNDKSKQIQELINNAELSESLVQAIQSEYMRLGGNAVAIRSSATAEDLPEASFAGQQESYLNITSFHEVIKHIKKCWASLWTPRAIHYRARQGIGNDGVYMAVVVQIMVQAEVAGVMFTANPLNNKTDQVVISASYGLGEAIVSGNVMPDTFVLDKTTLQALKAEIGSKELMIFSNAKGGTQEQGTDAIKRTSSSLSDEHIAILGELGRQVEKHFGFPQDIEWAYAEGTFFLLQARSIAAQQSAKNASGIRYNQLEAFLLAFLLDYFPVPPYHFDRSILLTLVEVTLGLTKVFGLTPPKVQDVIRTEQDGSLSLNPVLPQLTWRTPIGLIRGVAQSFQDLKTDPSVWIEEQWPKVEKQTHIFHELILKQMEDTELLDLIRKCISIRDYDIFVSRFKYFLGGFMATGALPFLIKFVVGKDKSGALHYALMSGLEGPTAFMNQRLRKLTSTASSIPMVEDILAKGVSSNTWGELKAFSEGQSYLDEVGAFLDQFGVRTGMLIPYPSSPIWEENPEKVLSLIELMLRSPQIGEIDPSESQKEISRKAEARVLEAADRFPFSVLKIRELLKFLIRYVQAMTIERDWIIFAYESINLPLHKAMLEIGNRLTQRGIIMGARDIRFLSLDEAEEACTASPTSNFAKALRKELKKRKLARAKTTANWNSLKSSRRTTTKGVLLAGTPASPGTTSGPARIILSEDDFTKLQPGEILICRATNPSWTPLFSIASAVVTDTGGPLSHAAIVAREYGIPAVLGTKNATGVIRDGNSYIVDGTRGEVRETQLH